MRGDRLRELRDEFGYSRERLAVLLEISESSIPRYENGQNIPSADVVLKIAKLFGVTSDYLLGLSDERDGRAEENFSPSERAALTAWRNKNYREAIRIIVNDET